jgi:CBS domain-containing protein
MSIELEKAGLDRSQPIIRYSQSHPIYCDETETTQQSIERMLKTGHRRLPVVTRKHEFVGMITVTDILDLFLRGQQLNDKLSLVVNRDVLTSKPTDSLGVVLQKFKLSRKGAFPILEGRKLVSIVSERDIVYQFKNVDFGIKVEEAMTKKPLVLKPTVRILDAMKSVVNSHYRRLPIVDGKKLVGIITATDLMAYLKAKNFSPTILDEELEKIMIQSVQTISKDIDLHEAIQAISKKEIGGIPVVDGNNHLEGLLTERDILDEIV